MRLNQPIIRNNKHFENSIKKTIEKNSKEIYSYINTYTLYLANKKPKFEQYLQSANYLRVGGIGAKIYYKLLLNENIEKVTFSHFFINFGGNKFISKNNFSVYCLGGTPSVANELNSILKKEKIELVGFHNGFFSEKESEVIINEINNLGPQILLIGLGTPLSDYWTFTNKDKLPNCAIIHVGNTFDLLTGNKHIGPKFLFNSGFEWAFRLAQEPKRLFKRYLFANTYVIYFIIITKLKNAFSKN